MRGLGYRDASNAMRVYARKRMYKCLQCAPERVHTRESQRLLPIHHRHASRIGSNVPILSFRLDRPHEAAFVRNMYRGRNKRASLRRSFSLSPLFHQYY